MPSSSSRSGSYIAWHWRGELSLPKSFWINGVGILIAFVALGRIFATIVMGEEYNPISMGASRECGCQRAGSFRNKVG